MIKCFTRKYIFAEDDEGMNGDYEEALIDDETENVLLWGDYYHNKISFVIDGFLDGLRYAGIEYEVEIVKENGNW